MGSILSCIDSDMNWMLDFLCKRVLKLTQYTSYNPLSLSREKGERYREVNNQMAVSIFFSGWVVYGSPKKWKRKVCFNIKICSYDDLKMWYICRHWNGHLLKSLGLSHLEVLCNEMTPCMYYKTLHRKIFFIYFVVTKILLFLAKSKNRFKQITTLNLVYFLLNFFGDLVDFLITSAPNAPY